MALKSKKIHNLLQNSVKQGQKLVKYLTFCPKMACLLTGKACPDLYKNVLKNLEI